MSVKLKPITSTSWLVLGDTEDIKLGLLTEIKNQYILMASGAKQQFLNRKEVNKYFNEEDIFKDAIVPVIKAEIKKDHFINGFPVTTETPCEVLVAGNKLPLFSKSTTSDIVYAAGYYCLEFPKNIRPAFCPKLSTLQTYNFYGPYATEIEMNLKLSSIRKIKDKNKYE